MKTLTVFVTFIFVLACGTSAAAQQARMTRGEYHLRVPQEIHRATLNPLPAGDYTVGTGGDFPTIDSAFNRLSLDGIAGPVILDLIDSLYTAPTDSLGFFLNGPIPGAAIDKQVTIRPRPQTEGALVQGSGGAVFTFMNTSYVTMNGLNPAYGPSYRRPTLTIRALHNDQFVFNDGIDFLNNSTHNTVQNVTVECEDYTRDGIGIGFWVINDGTHDAPDSNLICNNFIKKAGYAGILVSGQDVYGISIDRPVGNIIKGNNIGSDSDSLITWGIQVECSDSTIIEENTVQNIRRNFTAAFMTVTHGINCFWCDGSLIRNNVVHNVFDNGSKNGAAGILLSGGAQRRGGTTYIENNMVYDIRNSSQQSTSQAAGIQMWEQDTVFVYDNSIFLNDEHESTQGSAPLCIRDYCWKVVAKNNIFVNDGFNATGIASSIYESYSTANLISDRNDLYFQPYFGNCLVNIAGTHYDTMEDWQKTGNDSNSISEMPHFTNGDLHIDPSIPTHLESHGQPIAGIDADFDGEPRNATSPDIGADEFDGQAKTGDGVDYGRAYPKEFALTQNYPNPFNPTTAISYQLPAVSHVTLKVYDVLGREVVTLVNEVKHAGSYSVQWDASRIASGVYFYRLSARQTEAARLNAAGEQGQPGSFTETKKLILLR